MVGFCGTKLNAAGGLLAFVLIITTFAESVSAKNNPPGCRNPGAAAHNPHCSGQAATHTEVPVKPTAIKVNTIAVPVKPGFQQYPNWQGKRDPSTGFPVPPDPPAQQTPQPMQQ